MALPLERVARLCAVAIGAGVAMALAPAAEAGLPRAGTDRPDDRSGVQVHVLYVVPRDGVDRELDTNSVLTSSVSLWQEWLRRETGGRQLYVDTFQGELDVSFFRLGTDDAVVASRGAFVREQIEEEIFAAGFNSPSKLYAVYYDGSSTWSCGGGDPDPVFRGRVGAIYLRGAPPGSPPCATNPLGVAPVGYFEFAMLHEIMHTLDYVPACAPHVTRVDHVSDSQHDLMWAGDAPWLTNQPDLMRLDDGHDDYYGHGRSDCPDFAREPFLAPASAAPTPPGGGGGGGGGGGVPPDFTLSIGHSPATVAVGDTFAYTFTVANTTNGMGTQMNLTFTLPERVEFLTALFERGNGCRLVSGTTYTCFLDFMSGFMNTTIRAIVRLREAGELRVNGAVGMKEQDANPADNAASYAFTVQAPFTPPATPTTPKAPAKPKNVTKTGTSRPDVLRGGKGNDLLRGLGGNDRLYGGLGNDRLLGGAGKDRLEGHKGRDTLDGGAGNDTIVARDKAVDTIRCGPGRDVVVADRNDKVAKDCEVVHRG